MESFKFDHAEGCHKLLIKMKDTVSHQTFFPIINLGKLRVCLSPGLSGFLSYKTQEMKGLISLDTLPSSLELLVFQTQTSLQVAEDVIQQISVRLLILELSFFACSLNL